MAGSVDRQHARNVRHRKFKGLERGGTNPRLRKFEAWLTAQSTKFTGTGAGQVFTAAVTDIVTITAHGRLTGDGPFELTTDTTLPAGLAVDTHYWVNVIDVNTFKLFRSRADAAANINEVNITDTGTGIHTLTPSETNDGVVEVLRQENDPDTVEAVTDIDDLI